jgi:hypothetical protein
MALIELLETILGKIHFYITVGRKPAAEIFIEKKTIIIEILNPILAIDIGIQIWLKFRKMGKKGLLTFVKKSGYRIKIKYKRLQFEL